jgi:hypothetical protein
MKFITRIKGWIERMSLPDGERNRKRNLRRTIIQESKTEILRDLMLGHNIGDYTLNNEDLNEVIRFGTQTPISVIIAMHKKYRGPQESFFRDR